ncbi:hypothetical protein [Actinomadura nitritigenes]|uniref:hypothetical protein n=1 Tax=Actinomadura nitritigenes TaxID=134602 RepID=UPI003D905FBC
MNRSELEAGVLYGYRRRHGDRVVPLVLLAEATSDRLYWADEEAHLRGEPRFRHEWRMTKPHRAKPSMGVFALGWPAVAGEVGEPEPERLLKVGLEDFERAVLEGDAGPGLRFLVVTNAAYVVGRYGAVTARGPDGDGPAAHAAELVAALAELGITARADATRAPANLLLPLGDVERLLGMAVRE